jgi:hypothetical protein
MAVAIYVHLQPEVPASVLPLGIRPPLIPLFFMLLAGLNLFQLYRGKESACELTVSERWLRCPVPSVERARSRSTQCSPVGSASRYLTNVAADKHFQVCRGLSGVQLRDLGMRLQAECGVTLDSLQAHRLKRLADLRAG